MAKNAAVRAMTRRTGVPVSTRRKASVYGALACGVMFLMIGLFAASPHESLDREAMPGSLRHAMDGDVDEVYVGGRRLGSGRNLGNYPPDFLLGGDLDVGEYHTLPVGRQLVVIIHCIGITYMLIGLNLVCDVYFTGALEIMVDKWQVKPDVAGATFMAAGGSAPELFASTIGVCVSESLVGFSTIVGSAVFNVLFVIGLCGYVAKSDIKLTWWPLFRDCTYYIFGLLLLAIFVASRPEGPGEDRPVSGGIDFAEALLLFIAYLLYCTIMYFNPQLENLIDSKLRKKNKQVTPESEKMEAEAKAGLAEGGEAGFQAPAKGDVEANPEEAPETNHPEAEPNTEAEFPQGGDAAMADGLRNAANADGEPKDEEAGEGDKKEDEEEEEEDEHFMTPPWKWAEEGSAYDKFVYYYSFPVYCVIYYGLVEPDRSFFGCFLESLLYIAGFSFFLVWWVEIMCDLCYIDSTVAGFTVLAAGTSIPDAVSSMAVAKMGEGDMAVSSSIGSNIFDILVGLPLPWMIKLGIIEGVKEHGQTLVPIDSPYLVLLVALLLFMVFMVVVCIHLMGWKLSKKLGGAMAVLYFMFLLIALMTVIGKPCELQINPSVKNKAECNALR